MAGEDGDIRRARVRTERPMCVYTVHSTCGCTSDTAVHVIGQYNRGIISVIISEIYICKKGGLMSQRELYNHL